MITDHLFLGPDREVLCSREEIRQCHLLCLPQDLPDLAPPPPTGGLGPRSLFFTPA